MPATPAVAHLLAHASGQAVRDPCDGTGRQQQATYRCFWGCLHSLLQLPPRRLGTRGTEPARVNARVPRRPFPFLHAPAQVLPEAERWVFDPFLTI